MFFLSPLKYFFGYVRPLASTLYERNLTSQIVRLDRKSEDKSEFPVSVSVSVSHTNSVENRAVSENRSQSEEFPNSLVRYDQAITPTIKRTPSAAVDSFDVQNPPEEELKTLEPYFEITERMPHLTNTNLIVDKMAAARDVLQTRSSLEALGRRPDHEIVEAARIRLSEIEAHSSQDSEEIKEDIKIYKVVLWLDEQHEAYEKMRSQAYRRFDRIYDAIFAGNKVVEEEELVQILKDIESGKEIETLDLQVSGLGIFPEAFGQMKSLVVMNLTFNHLEALPDSIAGLEKLEEFYLYRNNLESLPDSIGLLFKLKVLDVSVNKLNALPDSISHCRLLEVLDVSRNKLTYLPTNLGHELVNLKRLSIHLNKIRSLPVSIGDMKALRILDAHFNELHGLPESIGKLANLEILNLRGNLGGYFTRLPDTISDLNSLKELDLSSNKIHALPDTFGHLLGLSKLNLSENPLKVPPKEVVAQGVESVKAYMVKRHADILMKERRKNIEMQQQSQAVVLTKSISWLKKFITNVVGTTSEYLGIPKKSNAYSYLKKEL